MNASPSLEVIDSVPVSEDVVRIVEQVLDAARAGDVSMVAIATVERSGCAQRAWAFGHNIPSLIGAVELLKRDIVEKFRDD